jgi:TonB family protein
MKMLYVCLFAALNCFAASIEGFVSDPSGGNIAGAQVVVTHLDTQKQVTVVTSDSGAYSLADLVPGKYQVVVRVPGFATAIRGVTLENAQSAKTVPLIVDIGQIVETITVVGQGVPAARTPDKVRMGGVVKPPRALHMPKVAYPASAKARGVEGSVVVRCVVSTEGTVINAKAVRSPDSDLEQAVLETVKQWRYEPAALNGVPVEVITTLTVNFQLKP